MPEPKKMTELEESLEKAILAKNAKQIMEALTKVRNEQQAYDDMVEKEMSYSKRMDSEKNQDNMRKAGVGTIEKKSFEEISPIQKKNYERLPVLMKKGEDALMDLKED